MIHTAIYAQVWDDAPCKVIGALNWAFLTINLCFYAVIAVITYLRVCREIYFHYGKYDYKLWVYVLTGSAALQVLNLQNNGKRDYWCAAKSGQINSAIILFSTIGIVLIVILFCYLRRSFGGVGNVVQFIINEGFIVKTNINISDDNNDNNNILLKSNNNSDVHLESHINNSNDNKIIIISENN
ncbi:unnamed protein product [Rhizophagus irregularis]|nr:unnamed protein product [Rhizophagus irregularis]